MGGQHTNMHSLPQVPHVSAVGHVADDNGGRTLPTSSVAVLSDRWRLSMKSLVSCHHIEQHPRTDANVHTTACQVNLIIIVLRVILAVNVYWILRVVL